MLRGFSQTRTVDSPDQIPVPAPALFLRADHLFDARVLAALINTQENLVLNSVAGQPVAVRVTDGNMRHVPANFMGEGVGEAFPDLPRYTLKDLNLRGLQ